VRINIEVPPQFFGAKGGPAGEPPLVIGLDPEELGFEPADALGLYKATGPLRVNVRAQWPRWRVSCMAVDAEGPDGFSEKNVFMTGGLGPADEDRRNRGRSGPQSLDTPQVVAEGERLLDVAGVAELGVFVQLDPEQAAGEYAFTLQFFGEGPGASGPFPGPAMTCGFEAEPVIMLDVDPPALEFGSVRNGLHVSRTSPVITTRANVRGQVRVRLNDVTNEGGHRIPRDRMALGVGPTEGEAAEAARHAPAGQDVTLRVQPGVQSWRLAGRIGIELDPPGHYTGTLTVHVAAAD
jgi:hypothetical protein